MSIKNIARNDCWNSTLIPRARIFARSVRFGPGCQRRNDIRIVKHLPPRPKFLALADIELHTSVRVCANCRNFVMSVQYDSCRCCHKCQQSHGVARYVSILFGKLLCISILPRIVHLISLSMGVTIVRKLLQRFTRDINGRTVSCPSFFTSRFDANIIAGTSRLISCGKRWKALLIAAALFLDMRYYERGGRIVSSRGIVRDKIIFCSLYSYVRGSIHYVVDNRYSWFRILSAHVKYRREVAPT